MPTLTLELSEPEWRTVSRRADEIMCAPTRLLWLSLNWYMEAFEDFGAEGKFTDLKTAHGRFERGELPPWADDGDDSPSAELAFELPSEERDELLRLSIEMGCSPDQVIRQAIARIAQDKAPAAR